VRVFWILVLGACNQVYGLEPTVLSLGDAHAPFRCPEDDSPPQFSPQLKQVLVRPCYGYTVSTRDLAAAWCDDGIESTVETGPVDGDLTPISLPLTAAGAYAHQNPALAPEGDLLLARQVRGIDDYVDSAYRLVDGAWQWESDVLNPPGYGDFFGVPSAAPDRRLLVTRQYPGVLSELAESGGVWTEIATRPIAELGARAPVQLSPDGLRAIFIDQQRVMYARRETKADPFTNAELVPTAPRIIGAFMTADCGRLYFSELGSIWYAEQL